MKYYSDIKRNGIWGYFTTWADLTTITATEISQAQKAKYSRFHLCAVPCSVQLLESDILAIEECGKWAWRVLQSACKMSPTG